MWAGSEEAIHPATKSVVRPRATRQMSGHGTAESLQEPAKPEALASASRRAALLSVPTAASIVLLPGSDQMAEAKGAAAAEAAKQGPKGAVEEIVKSQMDRGINAIRNPALSQGLATTLERRQELEVQGLLPAGVSDLDTEVDRALQAVRASGGGLPAYQLLMVLRSTNEEAFYALLAAHPEETLPLVYTPTVGDACQGWGRLLLRPQGLYISLQDAGHVRERLAAWPSDDVSIAVVTDGERILGLGDLGAHGMGISVGKSMLYSVAGGVPPSQLLPIAVDAGCNTDDLREDRFYMGLRQKRDRSQAYDNLIEELVGALRERYGDSMLLHWEDFGAKNAFRLLKLYQQRRTLPTFNDDIQSTAAAVLAALLGAVRIQGVPRMRNQRLLFFGAGQANIGAAKLFVTALRAEGVDEDTAKQQVWMMDSKGLITTDREQLTPEKAAFARAPDGDVGLDPRAAFTDLEAVVRAVRPSALVGAASIRGAFSEDVVKAVTLGLQEGGKALSRPVVMALSNPLTRSECTAEEALAWSGGAAVFASGTLFGPVTKKSGEVVVPSQANNSLIFPGIGLGCLASGATRVTDEMFYAAAKAVANSTSPAELRHGSVLPSTSRIREVSTAVAVAVAEEATKSMVASNNGRGVLPCLQSAQANYVSSETDASVAETACIKSIQYMSR